MGYNNTSMFFLGALFAVLVATTTPLAYGQEPLITLQVQVTGRLVCSPSGNPVAGTTPVVGVDNAVVNLLCRRPILIGPLVNVATTLTDSTGHYSFVITPLLSLTFNRAECRIRIPLPVRNCTLLPITGTLEARPILVSDGPFVDVYAAGPYLQLP